jgi:hypothetical protein
LPPEAYDDLQPDLAAARATLDERFWAFVQARYSAVDYYQDNKGPIGLTAVNRWLCQQVAPQERLALLCFDGLALDQWFLLRDYLEDALPGLAFRENRTYAVAPTLTPVSRQALFTGRPPRDFAGTLDRTDQDAAGWQTFWVNWDVPPRRVAYLRVQVDGRGLDQLRTVIDGKNCRLGVLVNLFDEVMHAVKRVTAASDKRVFYDTLRAHLENGRLDALFERLLGGGYRVFVTSDHGNLAGVGMGVKPPQALVESYARRVALFDQAALAQTYAQTHGLRVFRTKALPPDLHPVYPGGNDLFDTAGAVAISHGGLSMEELIVPFVEVTRP